MDGYDQLFGAARGDTEAEMWRGPWGDKHVELYRPAPSASRQQGALRQAPEGTSEDQGHILLRVKPSFPERESRTLAGKGSSR